MKIYVRGHIDSINWAFAPSSSMLLFEPAIVSSKPRATATQVHCSTGVRLYPMTARLPWAEPHAGTLHQQW